MDTLLRKNHEMSAILEVSRVLTASFNLEENLKCAMETLSKHLDMQRGCVFLLDPVSQGLRIVAAHGLTPREILRGTYRIGEGIVGKVMETGAPMFVPNIGEEPKFLNKTESRPEKKGISFLCIPITLERKTLGVLSVDRIYAEERGSVDDDLRVLYIVASFTAQFVKLWEMFKRTQDECGSLRSQLEERYSMPNIIGQSHKFQHVLKMVMKVAHTDTNVLLLGESGTGKELIAQTLHYQSHRAKSKFVAVNLAALPENLIEAELFGVEKGAFTGATARRIGRFETAHTGTLFLDEIGELTLQAQVKLLRVLQERTFERIGSAEPITVDVRVVAATNRNLLEEVQKGNFREDLYWRLNVVPIVLPPLIDRKEDIPLLIEHYLKKFNKAYHRNIRLKDSAISVLMQYQWPGNVRELANTVERFVIMAEHDILGPEDLPSNLKSDFEMMPFVSPAGDSEPADLNFEVQHLEKERIMTALKKNNFNQQKTSLALGISPRQLGYRIKKYGITYKKL
jgi:Nif-specific regulatory protein